MVFFCPVQVAAILPPGTQTRLCLISACISLLKTTSAQETEIEGKHFLTILRGEKNLTGMIDMRLSLEIWQGCSFI